MRAHEMKTLTTLSIATVALLTTSCASTSQDHEDYQSRLPDSCFDNVEDALEEFSGELYDQVRYDTDNEGNGDPGDHSIGLMNCYVIFFPDDLREAEGPVLRHARFSYDLITEDLRLGAPEKAASERYQRKLDAVPPGVTAVPTSGVGDESHSWYQEQPASGAHAVSRRHNLTLEVIVSGNDRNADGTEAPMPGTEAEQMARMLAAAVISSL
ncbi:hypothetical protein FHR81_002187 [Actinoalloteichus hoggarensis]|uniref:Uncharacterized protein n=1 Tax=Actinoalloteichus hoggarensis TaxID=1470176 RepID=A0A221W6M1_9PSEU|nr:hypothetical protein [Actinoalloteichus hoggarensis]ASO21219.1 hypothetical protein AHOG_17970 [Actinoalloteichus hoggarensis]MBB5921149.1 hypothetical protein [Actinoalloteichus hoggarensis]